MTDSSATYTSTAKTPAAEKYRGQRAFVLAALAALGGKATSEQIIHKIGGKYTPLTEWCKANGGIAFSVRWHLTQLVSDGLLKREGVEPKHARKATVKAAVKRAVRKAKAAPAPAPEAPAPTPEAAPAAA